MPTSYAARCATRHDGSCSSGDLRECDLRLPSELLTELLAVRHAAAEALTTAVLAEIGADRSSPCTGPVTRGPPVRCPGFRRRHRSDVGAVVLPNWEPGAAGVESVRNVRASLPDPVAVGSYVTAVGPGPADLVSHVRDLCGAGATELHLYHLGLAGPRAGQTCRRPLGPPSSTTTSS